MTEAPKGPSDRMLLREALSRETITLAPVTERNFPVFEKTLAALSEDAGMLPVTGDASETPKQWLDGTRALWLFGTKADKLLRPDEVVGFVNAYEPEHMGKINDWLTERGMRTYDPGAVVEMSSFARGGEADAEMSADKLALQKIFTDETFRDVRAVTVWADNGADNTVDPAENDMMKKLGGLQLGSTRYDASEAADSTCYLITRRAFINAMTGQKRG